MTSNIYIDSLMADKNNYLDILQWYYSRQVFPGKELMPPYIQK